MAVASPLSHRPTVPCITSSPVPATGLIATLSPSRRLLPLMAVLTATALSAVWSPMAQASSSSTLILYGILDDSVNWSSNQGGAHKYYMSNGLAGPRFGFSGTEVLDGDTSAFFKLEQGFTDTGAANASDDSFQRLALVGLRDRHIGEISFGRQYSAYYSLVGPLSASGQVDGTQLAQPGDIDGLDTTMRLNQSVNYFTPTFDHWRIGLSYAFGGAAGHMGAGNSYSAAIGYANGPLRASAGYLRMNNTASSDGGWGAGASGSYLVTSVNTGFTSAQSVDVFGGGVTYAFSHLTVGMTAASTIYRAGGDSLFSGSQHFDALGTTFRYNPRSAITLSGGYDFLYSEGAQTSARYHEFALAEMLQLSKTVTVYLGQAFVHATGKTLGAGGGNDIVDATAVIGDGSAASGASSSGNQILCFTGIQYKF